jgi:S1-C subfamily serine protease
MKKIIRYGLISIIFFMIIFLIFSCGISSSYFTNDSIESGNRSLRESFIKVENKFSARECKDNKCTIERVISSASAFVVSSGKTGAYAITAAHFCEDDMDLLLQSVVRGAPIQKIEFYAFDIDMKKYDVNVITYDRKLDLCLIYVKKLQKKPALLAHSAPDPGDKAYNLAAPLGMFGSNMIPKLDGYFAGYLTRDPRDAKQMFSIYSIPAIGGSSGSPIFDRDGYIIGMIHSVNIRFPFITYSPTYHQLRTFISDNVPY